MISALKKLARKSEDAKSRAGLMPSGVSSMGQSLQKKFGRGVQYNMKIIIKGDRNTGKSTLLNRFQGKSFTEHYIPTNEIQVCSINWNYRVADAVVKVEVWDVVDKGKKKSANDGLKLVNEFSANDDNVPDVLDAEFLDVYKGTHGCIMMLDITKQWTFKYIERELPKIPANIPVLILANFIDMKEHRVVQIEEITEFLKNLDRGENPALVEYGECCLKNSFGLKFVHKFFNIPFLTLQRETLEKQLQINKEDMKATVEELSFHRESEEQDYDKFLLLLEKKAIDKKQSSLSSQPSVKENERKLSSSSTSSNSTNKKKQPGPVPRSSSTNVTKQQAHTIDDFVPSETIDSGFLGNAEKEININNSGDESEDSASDNEGNPMVSGFQDISSTEEDVVVAQHENSSLQKPNIQDVEIDITSDESEEEVTQKELIEVVQNEEDKDNEPMVSLKSEKLESQNDVVLNKEDSSFMDAWLDSPNTNPPDQKRSVGKSGLGDSKTKDLFKGDEPYASKASNLTTELVANTKHAEDSKENNSEESSEEKTKRHSERKNKDGEEVKEKRRSKHKHKKKTKESDEDERSGKKSKSKRKHRHKHSKSREKKDGNGADYESF